MTLITNEDAVCLTLHPASLRKKVDIQMDRTAPLYLLIVILFTVLLQYRLARKMRRNMTNTETRDEEDGPSDFRE